MFRFKVVATLFVIFAATGGAVYYHQSEAISEGVRAQIEARVRTAAQGLKRSRLLSDYALMAKTAEVAGSVEIAEILARTPESFEDAEGAIPSENDFYFTINHLMKKEFDRWDARLKSLSEKDARPRNTLADLRINPPDWFAILNAEGVRVIHNRDTAWRGIKSANTLKEEHPSIKAVLEKGESIRDVWIVKNSPMTISAAPVRYDQEIVGAVILGYNFTQQEAESDKKRISTEVAYFMGEHLNRSSSLSSVDEPVFQEILASKKLYEEQRGLFTVDLSGVEYIAAVGKIGGYASAKDAGFVVLYNHTDTHTQAREFLVWIPLAFAVAFLLALGVILAFFQQFLNPFEEIDVGVMEIINGNLDYWFEVGGRGLPSTMSQNLNIMVCLLSGRPLPEDDEAAETEHWAEDRLFTEELEGGDAQQDPVDAAAVMSGQVEGLSPKVIQLVKEDEEAYKRRLFREYVEVMRLVDLPVQGITFEKFAKKIDSNAEALKEKYQVTRVRFIVSGEGGKVSLLPVPII